MNRDSLSIAWKYLLTIQCLLVLSSIVLAIFTLLTTTVTHVSPSDWGLAAKLPMSFWLGLMVLGIFFTIGRTSRNWMQIAFILTIVYLFAIPTLIQENARVLGTSYPAAEGKLIAVNGRFVPDKFNIYRYHNSPGFLYFVSNLELVTGIPLASLCKYFPLLTIALYGLLVHSVLRMRFEPAESWLGASWFVCSWWLWQDYFSPQSIAFATFLTIFAVVTRLSLERKVQSMSVRFIAVFFVLLFSCVITHVLTTVVVLAFLFVLFVFYRSHNRFATSLTVIAVSSIAFSYLLFEADPLLHTILSESLSRLPQLLSLQFLRVQTVGSFTQVSSNILKYSITAINAVIALIFAIFIIRKKRNEDRYWILSLLGIGLPLLISQYGISEMLGRIYLFALIPMTFMVVRLLTPKKSLVLCLVLCLLLFVHVPAYYGGNSFESVTSSEIVAASFYLKDVPSDAHLFSLTLKLVNLIRFQEPASVKRVVHLSYIQPVDYSFLGTALSETEFIVYSNSDCNQFLYYQGQIPLNESGIEQRFNRVYDNPCVQIFKNLMR